MKILLVNWQDRDNPQGGGAEIHLHEIFGRLAKKGHEVSLLCGGWPGCPPRAELDGIQVYRVGTRHTFPFLARNHYDKHLRPMGHDVLVEDINKIPLYTTRWGAKKVVALVPHLFGSTAFQEFPAPMAAAVWFAERPLGTMYAGVPFEAISQSTRDDLVERGIARQNVEVIYPGIDSIAFTPNTAERAKVPTFAYLGRLKRYKGVHICIDAFSKVARKDTILEIAGAGDYRPALEAQARSLDLGGRVRFLGRVSEAEKLALLRRSWALLFASPKEGWGITNLEAAACATPVVASNSPGLRETVKDGSSGFLVRHGDADAMSRHMTHLAENPALVEQIGRQARTFAAEFSWDKAAEETEAHLSRVIGS
jgi:glycosyltransferase involved in cell wall biosynthesis